MNITSKESLGDKRKLDSTRAGGYKKKNPTWVKVVVSVATFLTTAGGGLIILALI